MNRRPRRAIEADVSTLPHSERIFPLALTPIPTPVRQPGTPPKHDLVNTEVAPVTQAQWEKLLGFIVQGARQQSVIEALGIDPVALEGMLRGDPIRYRAWREAIIAADRRTWSAQVIEDICDAVCENMPLEKACQLYGKDAKAFLRLARRDPVIKEMYEEARALAAELEADELRDIADDDEGDLDMHGKSNTAAVNRSKLRVETRLRLMSAFNRTRFAESKGGPAEGVKVQVNINHADRLESARARARRAAVVIDQPAEEEDDLSWLDS